MTIYDDLVSDFISLRHRFENYQSTLGAFTTDKEGRQWFNVHDESMASKSLKVGVLISWMKHFEQLLVRVEKFKPPGLV